MWMNFLFCVVVMILYGIKSILDLNVFEIFVIIELDLLDVVLVLFKRCIWKWWIDEVNFIFRNKGIKMFLFNNKES